MTGFSRRVNALTAILVLSGHAAVVAAAAWLVVRGCLPARAGVLEQLLAWGWSGVAIIAANGVLLGALGGLGPAGFWVADLAVLLGLAALRRAHRRGGGGGVGGVLGGGSLFLSRVDTLVDKLLEERGGDLPALRGRTAVAMARLAYEAYQERFHGAGFEDLAAAGARPQYMLWASTGTKNPAYSDLLYVEPLIGAETINTLPDATLDALRDHGRVASTLEQDVEQAAAHFTALAAAGIDLVAVGERLQQDGLAQFEQAFAGLLELTA